MSAVVSDSSPLHYLIECGAVDTLQALFGEVLIPPEVFQELQHERTPKVVREWIEKHPEWIKIRTPKAVDPTLNLDEGERQAISLALEVGALAILMDDRKGRSEAARLGLRVTGTIGLLEAAASRNLLDFKEAIQRLRATRARLDSDLIQAALKRLHL